MGNGTSGGKSYTFKCPDDVIECQATHQCWGWYNAHTYKPFSELIGQPSVYIAKINFQLNLGPSEDPSPEKAYLQIKGTNGKWKTVSIITMTGSEGTENWNANVNEKATQVRIIGADPSVWIDGSQITVYTVPDPSPNPNPNPNPEPNPNPNPPSPNPNPSPDYSKYMIYALIGVGAIVILYLVLKRK